MARYIDEDKLAKELRDYYGCSVERDKDCPIMECAEGRIILNAPTAAVAPREEVEKWFRECEELQGRMIEIEKELRKEIATEILEELRRYIINHCYLGDDDVDAIMKHIEKLEKRYKEDDN